jgi:uncharacterized protein
VQEDFIAILRFDSESNLQTWLESPQRRQLLDEAAPLTAEWCKAVSSNGFATPRPRVRRRPQRGR